MRSHLYIFNSKNRVTRTKRQLFVRILFFVVAAVIIQAWITKKYYFQDPPLQKAEALAHYKFDLLYLTDSTDFTFSPGDKNRLRISEFLGQLLPQLNVQNIESGAYNISVYLEYLKYFIRKNNKPKYVVIPINLESFSTQVENAENYKFIKHRFALRYGEPFKILYRPLQVFKFHFGDWDDLRLPEESILSESTPELRNVERLYLTKIEESRQKLNMLAEFSILARRNGIIPIFFILPIDYQECEKYFGQRFATTAKENIKSIINKLASVNEPVLDLSFSLGSTDFMWREQGPLLNNHMTEKGRAFVANKLADLIIHGKFAKAFGE